MKQTLIDILNRHCPNNVYLQGTMNPEADYPAEFVTFWTNSTDDSTHYDNAAAGVIWHFSVMFYSNDPARVQSKSLEIAADLKAAGFVQSGIGHDLLSDEPTHTGWAMDFYFNQKI